MNPYASESVCAVLQPSKIGGKPPRFKVMCLTLHLLWAEKLHAVNARSSADNEVT